eukprot:TRINITY_DN8956_c0_g1_i2.p1 TRINITY_DN8956_c0_g1~~TRINITY_DN8956_c0_g1_i2.p1  ORF type:complete len:188 (-),score=45.58 TRINITY_DN8956_c0_g1_i2:53-616(-)
MGGQGGEDYVVHRGDVLTGADSQTGTWHFKSVLVRFIPKFENDLLKSFVVKKKVSKIILVTGDYLNFIEFIFNDGSFKRGGGNIEYIHYPYTRNEIVLAYDEYITAYELRSGQVIDSITFWTNKRGIGTFGGRGGRVKEKKIGFPGQTLVDVEIVSMKFKNSTMVQNITNSVWKPAARVSEWTDAIW